jgi:hypothetical protein
MYDNDAMFLNLRSSKEIMSYKLTALLKICGEFVQPSDKDGISHYFNKMAEIEKYCRCMQEFCTQRRYD